MSELTTAEANRIMAHMNGDHEESLIHYIQYSAKIKQVDKPVRMTKFTTNEMVIAYGKARKQVSIEFNPPMLAGQARKRLEELHNESRTALGLSPITINSINLSKSTSIVLAVATILQVALVVSPGELLVTNMPWLATKATALLQYLDLNSATLSVGTAMKLLLVVPLQSAHLGEAILFLMPLMRKFNMTSPSVRLFYFIATIIGGFPVWSSLKQSGESQEFDLKAKSK